MPTSILFAMIEKHMDLNIVISPQQYSIKGSRNPLSSSTDGARLLEEKAKETAMRSDLILIAVIMAVRSAMAIELFELKDKMDPKKCTKEKVQAMWKLWNVESRQIKYRREENLLKVSVDPSTRYLELIISCHNALYNLMNIKSHPSEGTHPAKCKKSMVIIGVCVGLKDITYLGMGCHATADNDAKDLASNKEWKRICADGDSIEKKSDSDNSGKIPVSTLICAVIGAIAVALVIGFLSGFFCNKKFSKAKPDETVSVTPVSTDQANKTAEKPTQVADPAPPKEEPKKPVTPVATDEQKTLDEENTDLQSYKSDLKAPTSETSKSIV